jgi:hypothetical protein
MLITMPITINREGTPPREPSQRFAAGTTYGADDRSGAATASVQSG